MNDHSRYPRPQLLRILIPLLLILNVIVWAWPAMATPAEPAVTTVQERWLPKPSPGCPGPCPSPSPTSDLASMRLDDLIDWHDPHCAGWRQRYTISFTNDGEVTLTNVMVRANLEEDTEFDLDDCSEGLTVDGPYEAHWLIPEVAPGESVVLYLEIRVWSSWPEGSILTTCVTVSSDQLGAQSVCEETVIEQCETPSPTATPTSSDTPTPTNTLSTLVPSDTPTPTDTPSVPTFTPTSTNTPGTPTPSLTPSPTPTPIVECFASSPGFDRIYRVDASLFRGYDGSSSGDYPLHLITSPPAPAGWNSAGFVPDASWGSPSPVYWPAWAGPGWNIVPEGAVIEGLLRSNGAPEGVDGTTHLLWRQITLTPPGPGWEVTEAWLEMWSDNKTAWWWNGVLVMSGRQGQIGRVDLLPGIHLDPAGGSYSLAVQNSNDYMRVENPQGTAYRMCVTYAYLGPVEPSPTPTAWPPITPDLWLPLYFGVPG